ncbi:MAG: hypothetical protein JWO85_2662 [Candidatus Eremiobacteraeota bacterium]|nr:hypothetical protein [Candidatus Eremiobacteraeota bacterium]
MPEVPPPGPPLPYVDWCRVLVARLRELIPAVRATYRAGVVYLRHTGEEVTITDDRGTFWVRRTGSGGSGLYDSDRHDVHTARTMAKSIAGMLDANLSGPTS